MDARYKVAWKEGDTAVYVDAYDCKYAAKNGNLAWRINNPGLIKHHCHFARKNGSIGAWEKFAIFSNPHQGHQALKEWLQSKKLYASNLYAIGKHYQPSNPEQFAHNLASSCGIPPKTKLKDLSHTEFETLLSSIQKLCGYVPTEDQEFLLLPKIAAKIESPGKADCYLIGNDLTLTHEEAINWINSHRLDAVIVRHSNGNTYLRSRPHYHMQTWKLTWGHQHETGGKFDVLARAVGEKILGQCIWGFINGIRNSREDAIESAKLISRQTENEQVFSLRNDQFLQGAKEVGVAILLKLGIDTPIVKNAAKFLRYLLSISDHQEDRSPVIVLAHSQGAAIAEHAIALLSDHEKQKIRIFTFGGWSFIPPGVTHPESHNYVSVGDLIPRAGSFSLQYLALKKHEGLKEGLSHEDIIWRLAYGEALHDLNCLNPHVFKAYTQERCKHYRKEFDKISNVTILDSKNKWEHSFNNATYQTIVCKILDKYRNNRLKTGVTSSQNLLTESFV